MSKFEAGDRVRSDNNPEGGIGTVLSWNDPRCLFSPEDWTGHAAVAWEDESVTIVADGVLNTAETVDWDEEAEGPEELRGRAASLMVRYIFGTPRYGKVLCMSPCGLRPVGGTLPWLSQAKRMLYTSSVRKRPFGYAAGWLRS